VERGVLVHPGDELDVLAVRTEVVELQLVAAIRELYLGGQRGELFAILPRRLEPLSWFTIGPLISG
jgi:hypothetical protein